MTSGRVLALHTKPSEAARLPKIPVTEAIVDPSGIRGDYNHFRHVRKKDTPDRALLLLTDDILVALNSEGWPVKPGDLGENVLLAAIPYASLRAGLRLQLGVAVVEITEECVPCRTLRTLPYADTAFIKALKGRRGWFAQVLSGGVVCVEDQVMLRRT